MDLQPKTERSTLRLDATNPADITRAAEILRSGGTVAFPTETVYGLGANALSPGAVERIFLAKRRPHWDPLIVHIANQEMLEIVTRVPHVNHGSSVIDVGLVSSAAAVHALIEKFWPGPLTLLLPRTPAIPDAVTAGRPLVGVRMPAHPVALELIRQAGVPIAAPSANLFGHTSPTTAAHVLADLDGRIDAVLDAGPTTIGLESTVAGFEEGSSFSNLIIYRPGAITASMLSEVAGVSAHDFSPHYQLSANQLSADRSNEDTQGHASPGLDLRHYAPRARLILVDNLDHVESLEDSLIHTIDQAYDGHETIGVMLPTRWNPPCAQLIFPWGDWRDGETLAHRLFAGLRSLDDQGATIIICPVPTLPGIGEAIRDRLQKAARPA